MRFILFGTVVFLSSPVVALDVESTGPSSVASMAISPSTVTATQCVRSDSTGNSFKLGRGCGDGNVETFVDNVTVISTLTVQGTDFNVGRSTFAVSGGLVGVGMVVPLKTFVVKPSTNVSSLMLEQNNATDGWSFWPDSSDGKLAISREGNAGVRNALVILQSSGNVGISTNAPQTLLDVNGTASFGSGGTKSTFSATGNLAFPAGGGVTSQQTNTSSLTLTGAGAYLAPMAGINVPLTLVNSSSLTVSGGTFLTGALNMAAAMTVNSSSLTINDSRGDFSLTVINGAAAGTRPNGALIQTNNVSTAGGDPILRIKNASSQTDFRADGNISLPSNGGGFISPITISASSLTLTGAGAYLAPVMGINRELTIVGSTFTVLGGGGATFLGPVNSSAAFAINGLVAFSSVPIMHVTGSNMSATLAAGVTVQTFTPDSAVTLRRISITVVVAGVGGSGDFIYCNNSSGTGLNTSVAAAAAAGTTATAIGSANIAVGAAVSCHIEGTSTTKPLLNFALEYVMQ